MTDHSGPADMMHYCNRYGVSFDQCLETANEHFQAELAEEDERKGKPQ